MSFPLPRSLSMDALVGASPLCPQAGAFNGHSSTAVTVPNAFASYIFLLHIPPDSHLHADQIPLANLRFPSPVSLSLRDKSQLPLPHAPNLPPPPIMLPRLFYPLVLLLASLLFSSVQAATYPRTPDPRHLAPRVGDSPTVAKRAPGAIPADDAGVQQLPRARSLDERSTRKVEDLGRRIERSGSARWAKKQ